MSFCMVLRYQCFGGTCCFCLGCKSDCSILKLETATLFAVLVYTGCNRRNVRDFRRVFLRSDYTDITQNTYIQSSMVTEILAREKCGLLWCLHTVLCLWCHTRRIPTLSLDAAHSDLGDGPYVSSVYSGWKSVDNYYTYASVFVVQFNGFMSLTSYFDVMYRY
jgi:hypothetical protein